MRVVKPARIARSLVTVLVLTVLQLGITPGILNSALAYTQGTVTNGTAYGGTGGGANAANQNCTNGAVVAIGATKSGDNLNAFMYVCKTINNDASLSATEATTNVFNTPAESDRCAAGQIGIGVRVIASNGGSLVGGVGLICGNPMSQGNPDTRSIMPNASSAGTVYTYNCPTGQLLAGFALRTGALVDQIIPKCSSFSGFVFAAVGAPSATVVGSTASVSFATVSGSIADTALTYTVTAVPDSGSTITVTGSSSPISMPGMVMRANYTITVTASNTYGTSPSTSNATASMLLPGGDTDTSLTFNGSSQYAEVADTAASPYDITGSVTMEAWVYPTTDCLSDQGVIAKLNSYMLYCGSSGYWKYVFDADGLNWAGSVSTLKVVKNEWHHIALTKVSTSSNALFYIDGQLAQTVSAGPTTMTPNNDAFQIGRFASSNYFQGEIDEVRVYNSQRSQAQIAADMHQYGPISDSDLVAYYDCNEGTGIKLYNRKSTATAATDLTIYNSPTWDDVKITNTSSQTVYTTVTFPRTYITSTGGWKVPANVSNVTTLIVAGGGGGGWNSGGGGGGGGFLATNKVAVSGYLTVKVGAGGIGALSTDSGQTPTIAPGTGQTSQLGSTSVAGGNPGGVFVVTTAGGAAITTASGSSGAGGAGAATSGTPASAGSSGLTSMIDGTSTIYSSGGGGGGYSSAGGTGGSGAGNGGGTSVTTGTSAVANRGGGGGASSAHVFSGSGGSGVIIVRWITAAKPLFTPPITAYLNAGMTETFTTNVAQDSATVTLTRTFRWESSTTGAGGTFSLIKQGTGASNAYFSWIPTDTSTTGSNYVYRVIVTDSDTAGLFIVDTSTPVWAVINRALVVSGNSNIGKAINVSKSETFTITLGTSTYRPTLTPIISGITLDTSTAGLAVVKISDTASIGTFYETLTVVDSVSATIVTPLTIVIAPPPSLTANGDQVDSSTVLYLDAGNSASLSPATPTTWKDMSGRGLQASFPPLVMPTQNAGPASCTAPTYSNDNLGILNFSTDSCGYVPNVGGANLTYPYTYQTWVKRNGSMQSGSIDGDYTSIFATPWTTGKQIGITLHWRHVLNSANYYLEAGIWGNPTWYAAQWPTAIPVNTWVFVTVTFNGSSISISINDQTPVTAAVSTTIDKANLDSGLIIGKRFDQSTGYFFNGSIASLRLYNRVLTSAEITQNYNATKGRFDSTTYLKPTQKYGATQQETFTVTSGYGAKSSTFAVGDRTGIDWDTTTAVGQIKLSIQESLTVGTYNDTVTVTDSLGQSSFLTLSTVISKADSITVTIRNPKTLIYTGSPAASLPDIAITGLVSSDTGTATRLFSAPASLPGAPETYTALVNSSIVPTDVETYTVSAATLNSLTVGSLSNYQGVIYETSTLTITQAKQPYLTVNYFGAIAGSSFTLYSGGGAGGGAFTESVTAGGSGLNCALSGHVLSNSTPASTQSTCNILITKAQSRNYKSETLTATIYFLLFAANQPTQNGAGSTIGLNGVTSVTYDAVQAPTISSLSTTTLSLSSSGNFTITGAGFGTSQITVKFWRNKIVLATSSDGLTLVIPISAISSAGAATGRIIVITSAGIATSIDTLTITP